MEVILLKDQEHLGERGNVVDVSDGYARNYLIPKKIALKNTPSNRNAFDAEEQFKKIKLEKERTSAEKIKEDIDGMEITITRRAGKEDKLFGSVTKQQIADAIQEKGYEIDSKGIEIDDSIRELGTYKIDISLFEDIKASINLEVEEQIDD